MHAEKVTAEELAILHEDEPSAEFRVVEADLSQGRQSRVSVLEYELGGESFQVVWKRMGAAKGL